MRKTFSAMMAGVLPVVLSGCIAAQGNWNGVSDSDIPAKVEFNDPVLNQRQILLVGTIDKPAAERTIQKLLYLDKKSSEPIDLFLQTPGGEFREAMAIRDVMGLLQSKVNTYALSECNSGGAVLLAAGTGKRYAFKGAAVIIHGMIIYGRPPAGLKEQMQDAYTQFWQDHAKLPKEWLPLPRGVIHVLTADDALKYGVVDEIVGK